MKDNPNPPDEKVHKFAEKEGYSVDSVETEIYKLATKFVRLMDHFSENGNYYQVLKKLEKKLDI